MAASTRRATTGRCEAGRFRNNINNCKEIVLNSVVGQPSRGSGEHGEYKRSSKMSNLEIIQRGSKMTNCQPRPVSYAAGNEQGIGGGGGGAYTCNTVFVNNLDTLRSYGSAGDQLENVPAEYRKPMRAGQHQVN